MRKRVEDSWPASSVSLWPIEKILPYEKNPRVHSDAQVTLIAASMIEDGVTAPILVDEAGVIIYGHGRRLGALKNGFKNYPVAVAVGWSEQKKRTVRIKDNSYAGMSTWSAELIKAEVGDLKLHGYDIGLLGFPETQLRGWGVVLGTDGPEPDAVPEAPKKPVVRRGDRWVLGDHVLLCGDALSKPDVGVLLDGIVPDLANCDPPYGISIVKAAAVGGSKSFGSRGREHGLGKAGFGRVPVNAAKAIIKTGVYAEVIGDDSTETAIGGYKMLRSIGVPSIVLWGGNYYANELPPSRCWFVWDKKITGTFADVELAWTNCDQVARLFHHEWNGLMKASERGERRVHPTQKPVALAEWVIDTARPEAKTVVDLFVGSGSGLIACERRGLRFFGMELSPAYVQVVIDRFEKFSGKKATLDGKTLEQVAKARKTGRAVGRTAAGASKTKGAANVATPPEKRASAASTPRSGSKDPDTSHPRT